MTRREKHYDMHKLLEEIKASEGLPENLSTEAQLWDEIAKRMVFDGPGLMFPLIREIHGKVYPDNTEIRPLATEHSVERADTKEITSIRGDITIIVGAKDIYHFECQIKNDGTMVLRMFEYDVHIALSYYQIESADGNIRMGFPRSAVLYLQDNSKTPDELECEIIFQDGGTYRYKVPTVKVQTYSLEEIKEKHLCVLIPFLPLRFRKEQRKKEKLSKEELTSFYNQIILVLEEEVAGGYLSENNRKTILALLSKSMIRVFYRDESLLKEVVKMTEPILELEFDVYERMLKEQRRELEENEKTIAAQDETIAAQDETIAAQDETIAALQRQLEELRMQKA